MTHRFRKLYGAGPLHLIALAASFAVIAAAVVRWFDSGSDVVNILVWFGVAVVGHDLVFLPLYTVLDRIGTGPLRRRVATRESAWASAYVRIPVILSALLFVVFFPLILGTGVSTYRTASGHRPSGYLDRWLIATAVLFLGAGLAYALRQARDRRRATATQATEGEVSITGASSDSKTDRIAASEAVERHEAAGRYFEADGVRSFVRDAGDGEAVLCMHGVPVSCFVYRRLVDKLASRGLRGVAFDLPGLGLAARPSQYDYTWTGLGRFATAAVDALGLERFHLVVHDIGGPVGFEMASAAPERVLSLTLLNTMIEVDRFHRPWMMEPFAHRGIGQVWLASMVPLTFRQLMYYAGIADRRAVPVAEIDAHVELLKREDGGAAFLKIMRGFELTADKSRLYRGTVAEVPYPVQIVWGARDPALKLSVQGEQARTLTGGAQMHTLQAKHFLQEDQAPAIAERIAALGQANG
jgi:pimeloyl-ACP methyl ester carboxylesterase